MLPAVFTLLLCSVKSVLYSSLYSSSLHDSTLSSLSSRPAVGPGRPAVTNCRPADLRYHLRFDLCLRRDLRTAAELLPMVQENAEAAAETVALPEALNHRRLLCGINCRLKNPWKKTKLVDGQSPSRCLIGNHTSPVLFNKVSDFFPPSG